MHRWGGRGRARSGWLALVLGLWGTGACGGAAPPEVDPEPPDSSDAGAVPGAPSAPADCEELLATYQAHLRAQVRARVADALARFDEGGGGGAVAGVASSLRSPDLQSSAAFALRASSTSPPAAVGAAVAASGRPAASTVSEGDLLAFEGNLLYLIHGEFLHLVDFGAAPELVLRASLPIEGYGRQLLVHDGVAFVFSSVSAPEGGTPGLPRPPGYDAYFDKLTVIDTRAEPASVLREAYFEGALAGPVQRRGERALVTLQQPVKVRVDYPSIEPLDVFGRPRSRERVVALLEAWAAVREESIAASTLEDFLPFTYERRGDELVLLPFACASSLVPARGLGASSFTRLVALDLEAPEAALGAMDFLGDAENAFVGDGVAILREPDPGGYRAAQTNLHRLELGEAGGRITGTGRLDGHLDGIRLIDEAGGVIRAALTNGGIDPAGSFSQVVLLDALSPRLRELGRSAPFAPDQSLTTARFLDGVAIVSGATPETAALHVLDLSERTSPVLSGNLATSAPPWLLLPLPGGRVLGIGEAFDEEVGFNVVLQWLDVGAPNAPRLLHEYQSPKPGRLAAVDPRALSIDLDAGLLALPRQHNQASASVMDVFRLPAGESGFAHAGVVLLDSALASRDGCLSYWGYPTDPEGLEERGVTPEELEALLLRCEARAASGVWRSFVVGDVLVSLTLDGIVTHVLDGLAAPPLSQLYLPGTFYPPY